MSIGYLLTLGVVAGFGAIALWPPRRPRFVAQVAYFMGVTVNEVPQLALGVPLSIATLTEIASSDDAGSAALVATAGAVVALVPVAIARRALRSWPAVEGSLHAAALGIGERPRGWTWRTLLSPLPLRPRDVARIADERYGTHRRQRLDVYHRRDRPSGGPVLVYLHQGGYISGGKHREGRVLLHRLAARGWVCISAGYRLRPEADFEDHLADARSALEWARAHAAEHGGDPERIVMAGSSAGAHMASLLALDPGTDLAGAICLYGYYGRYYGRGEAETVPSTPFALSAAGAPPFFISHGDNDTWTPVEDARRFATKLREESSNPVVYAELPGAQHGFDLWSSWRYSAVVAGIEAFAARHVEERTDAPLHAERSARRGR